MQFRNKALGRFCVARYFLALSKQRLGVHDGKNMKFFIPAAEDKAQEQRVYTSIKEFLGKELGAVFEQRRVFSLRYVHNGKEFYAEVGKRDAGNGEPIVAILHEPARNLYHVCTTNRGVVRGISILVGAGSVKSCEDFEPE